MTIAPSARRMFVPATALLPNDALFTCSGCLELVQPRAVAVELYSSGDVANFFCPLCRHLNSQSSPGSSPSTAPTGSDPSSSWPGLGA